MSRPSPAELRKMYDEEGLSAGQIADKYGVVRSTASRWLHNAGINVAPTGRRPHIARPSDAELLKMAKTMPQSAIAEACGAAQSSVSDWIKQARRRASA